MTSAYIITRLRVIESQKLTGVPRVTVENTYAFTFKFNAAASSKRSIASVSKSQPNLSPNLYILSPSTLIRISNLKESYDDT